MPGSRRDIVRLYEIVKQLDARIRAIEGFLNDVVARARTDSTEPKESTTEPHDGASESQQTQPQEVTDVS